MRVKLTKDVRYFRKAGKGPLLCRTGVSAAVDMVVELQEEEVVTYDHKDQNGVPFRFNGSSQEYFFLKSDLDGAWELVPGTVH